MGVDAIYLDLVRQALDGEPVTTRNATTARLVGSQVVFSDTPLVSVRKTSWKLALREWEWFMSGSSNINDLHDSVRHWWQPWATEHGYIPHNYSWQFRAFSRDDGTFFDQIDWLIDAIKEHPFSRRNVITTWNPYEMQLAETPITNCHGTVIQFFGHNDGSLSMLMYQRSCDLLLGLPHNWIQYWSFLMWIAHRTGRTVGRFHWIGGDVHVYPQHVDAAKRMLASGADGLVTPKLVYKPTSEEFLADDFSLDGEYQPLISERLEMVV